MRWGLVGGIAAVVVGILVVLALALAYRPSGGGASYGSPMAFGQFWGPAQTEQQSIPDGPWTPVAALGVGSSASGPGIAGENGLGASGCSDLWTGSSSPDLPATPSGAPVGQVAAWFLASTNGAGEVLLTLATNGSGAVNAVNLAIVPGGCLTALTTLRPLAATVVDSPTIAANANANGGSTFLSDYPGATEEFVLLYTGWTVTYTTCSFIAPGGGNGNEFVATFDAGTGMLFNATTQSATC